MADETFDSLDAIEKHYGKARKAVSDDEVAVKALSLEEREAKADFRENAAIKRELDAHRRDALATAGIPEDFYDFVTGNTPEEIDASVTKVKTRIDKLTAGKTDDDDAAAALYGKPVQGGGTPPPPRENDEDKFVHDFEKRWNGKGANGGEGVTQPEIDRYVRTRTGANMTRHLRDNSRIPSVRAALASVKD
jgi:hypothetical protein